MLSWLGASVAGALKPVSATDTQAARATRVVTLESFCIADAEQAPRLHAYLGGTLLPLLKGIRERPAICMDAIVAPHAPQILLVAVFSSFDEMLDVRGRIASEPHIRQARAELESAQVLDDVRSQVLIATEEALRFPADLGGLKTGVLELRSYHAPAWHDRSPTCVRAVFSRSGIHPIVNAATSAGEHMPRFTYLIRFESLAARQEAWARLEADAEWIDIQQDSISRHGFAVKVTGKSIYKLATCSELA
ncbi:MAG TPA: NIPSNAP family protein [Bryobacteraceae bacterium]|nr:NIPSNAP family protein [Bryobacteraceae bacterium]